MTESPRVSRLNRWLQQRTKPVAEQTLKQRQIYILPSKAGWSFLALLALLLLLAINYQNNLIYGFLFLLLGVMTASMFSTYANLSGLCFKSPTAAPCFRLEQAGVRLPIIDTRNRLRQQIRLRFVGQTAIEEGIEAGERRVVSLPCRAEQRGWFRPGVIGVSTVYPLGLFNAWTWLRFDFSLLVYPRPVAGPIPSASAHASTVVDTHGTQAGDQDFIGLGRFRPGSAPSRIAWKQVSRGQGLYLKLFDEPDSETLWLDWEAMPELADEQRLERLCFWCLELDGTGVEFGLRLPTMEVEPNSGKHHLQKVLRTLALYGRSEETES